MARRSSIKSLPQELQDLVHRLIREGATIDEIREKLLELGHDRSRSALGRHVKGARKLLERYTAAREVAGKLVEQIGENPNGDVGSLLAEMLKTIAFQVISEMGEQEQEDLKPGAMDIMLIAKGLDHLERAGSLGYKRRKEIRADAIAEAAANVDKTGKQLGLSDTVRDQLIKSLKLL